MANNAPFPLAESADPTEAFNALRGQISLLQTALEGLTAAREKVPDYSEYLRAIGDHLRGLDRRLASIEGKPALDITPADFAAEMVRNSVQARAEDSRLVQTAHQNIVTIYSQLQALVRQADGADEQRTRYYLCAAGGAVAATAILLLVLRAFG